MTVLPVLVQAVIFDMNIGRSVGAIEPPRDTRVWSLARRRDSQRRSQTAAHARIRWKNQNVAAAYAAHL